MFIFFSEHDKVLICCSKIVLVLHKTLYDCSFFLDKILFFDGNFNCNDDVYGDDDGDDEEEEEEEESIFIKLHDIVLLELDE